jgi:hypothetical protein
MEIPADGGFGYYTFVCNGAKLSLLVEGGNLSRISETANGIGLLLCAFVPEQSVVLAFGQVSLLSGLRYPASPRM